MFLVLLSEEVVLSGKTYEHCVPDIETQAHTYTHSLYIYIHTHTGKTYEHRVPAGMSRCPCVCDILYACTQASSRYIGG